MQPENLNAGVTGQWWNPLASEEYVSSNGRKTLEVNCRDFRMFGGLFNLAAGAGGLCLGIYLLKWGIERLAAALPPTFRDWFLPNNLVLSCLGWLLIGLIAAFFIVLAIWVVPLVVGNVVSSLPWWVHWRFVIRREGGEDLVLRARGGFDSTHLRFLWMPDGSGFYVHRIGETGESTHLVRVPDGPEIPWWNGRAFPVWGILGTEGEVLSETVNRG